MAKKRSKIRILATLVVAVVVIAAVALGAGYYYLNDIVREGVRHLGPRYAGVAVTIDDVDLRPLAGRCELRGVTVGNPEGYGTPHAVRLEHVRVQMELGSLRSDTIRINEVFVDGPDINLELGPGGSNIQQIQRNIQERLPKSEAEKESAKKVVIDRLEIVNGNAGVSASFLGGKRARMPLKDIVMTDIGKGSESESATIGEVLNKVFEQLTDVLGSGLEGMEGVLGGGAELLKGAGSTGADAVGGGVEKLTEGLKGLLGGDK